MKVVYIIGPFRAKTPWEVEQNVRHAEGLALKVAHVGAMPLCPHTNTRHFNGLLTEKFWLDGTMELARRADAAIVVDGWENSEGSRGEVRDFIARGAKVFQSTSLGLAALRHWVETGVYRTVATIVEDSEFEFERDLEKDPTP